MRAFVAWPFLIVGFYMACAFIGSHIPANNGWIPAREGVDIFVEIERGPCRFDCAN